MATVGFCYETISCIWLCCICLCLLSLQFVHVQCFSSLIPRPFCNWIGSGVLATVNTVVLIIDARQFNCRVCYICASWVCCFCTGLALLAAAGFNACTLNFCLVNQSSSFDCLRYQSALNKVLWQQKVRQQYRRKLICLGMYTQLSMKWAHSFQCNP